VLKKLTSIALVSGLSLGLIGTAGSVQAANVIFSFSGSGRSVTGRLNGLTRGDMGEQATISNVTTMGFAAGNLMNVDFGGSVATFDVDAVTGVVTVAAGGGNIFPGPFDPLIENWLLTFGSAPNTGLMQCFGGACGFAGPDVDGTGVQPVMIGVVPIPFNFSSTLGLTLLGLAFGGHQVYKRRQKALKAIAPVALAAE
jgi:hypothetical protein